MNVGTITSNKLSFDLSNLILSDSVKVLSSARSRYRKFILQSIEAKLSSLNTELFDIPNFIDTDFTSLKIETKVIGKRLYLILDLV